MTKQVRFLIGICLAVRLSGVPLSAAELEQLVVTAQKKSEDIQDVAGSVGTLLEGELERLMSGGADANALSGRVAGLFVESSNGRLEKWCRKTRQLGDMVYDVVDPF